MELPNQNAQRYLPTMTWDSIVRTFTSLPLFSGKRLGGRVRALVWDRDNVSRKELFIMPRSFSLSHCGVKERG